MTNLFISHITILYYYVLDIFAIVVLTSARFLSYVKWTANQPHVQAFHRFTQFNNNSMQYLNIFFKDKICTKHMPVLLNNVTRKFI